MYNLGMGVSENKFHRRSVRLKGYDYSSPGAYFVTVVTYHRAHLFGEVINGKMKLYPYGEIAQGEWYRSAELRPNVRLHPDEFVVMPNHIHGIIWIDDNRTGAATLRPDVRSEIELKSIVKPKSLAAIIRSYKSAVTYQINAFRESRGAPIWQRNYYEHIIRNQAELDRIANYIQTNPVNWTDDLVYRQ